MRIKKLLLIACFGIITNAKAATSSAPMQVTATVASVCSISVDSINFGSFDMTSTNVSASSTIRAVCTKGTSYTLKMDGGLNSDGTYRYMIRAGGTEKLRYDLSGGGSSIPINSPSSATIGSGLTDSFPFNGALTGSLNVPVGNYSDTVIVSIEY